MAEKTEQPTPKKLYDAREEGQVIKSEIITRGMQLLAATLWFWAEGPTLVLATQIVFGKIIAYLTLPFDQALIRITAVCAVLIVRFIGSLTAVILLVTVVVSVVQTGFLFAPKALKFHTDALNPVSNVKNMFSIKKLHGLLRTILMVILLGLIFFHIFNKYSRTFIYLPACGLQCAIPVTAKLASWLLWCLIGFYIVFASSDYLFERHQLMKQLRMSKEDVKQEFKDVEGNPEVKQRMRQIHQEVQSSDMSFRVKRSTAVVKNPTHIAVCLYYKQDETPLPVVTEKGIGRNALQVIELAKRFKIPIVENILLARQLMTNTKIGDYIPEELFEPVAEVLRIAMLELDDQVQEEEGEEGEDNEEDEDNESNKGNDGSESNKENEKNEIDISVH